MKCDSLKKKPPPRKFAVNKLISRLYIVIIKKNKINVISFTFNFLNKVIKIFKFNLLEIRKSKKKKNIEKLFARL